jgi:crotonobetainyl-CoA:carnitine CoA-transferase CaiB-like acyl-CoA transferase
VCNALRKPEWLEDPRFTSRHERGRNGAAINEAMRELLASHIPTEPDQPAARRFEPDAWLAGSKRRHG